MAIYGYVPCLCEITRMLRFRELSHRLSCRDRSPWLGNNSYCMYEMDSLIIRAMGQITWPVESRIPLLDQPIGNQQCRFSNSKEDIAMAPIIRTDCIRWEQHWCIAKELYCSHSGFNIFNAGTLGLTARSFAKTLRMNFRENIRIHRPLTPDHQQGTRRVRSWKASTRGQRRLSSVRKASLLEHLSCWTIWSIVTPVEDCKKHH